jgi:uncharacterized RDD family membrane protein YckC/TM2 domain-containing membrane protein YozV
MSSKSYLATIILCFFMGCFGAHRFYAGKIGTGILQLLTFGGLGIWALIDLIIIACGNFTDKEGKKITHPVAVTDNAAAASDNVIPSTPAAAGFWIRVAATVIDSVIVGMAAGIISTVIVMAIPEYRTELLATSQGETLSADHDQASTADKDELTASDKVNGFVYLVLALLYEIILPVTRFHATPGKMVLGLAIYTNDYRPISLGRSIVRSLSSFLSLLPLGIGFMMAGWNKDKKALHDFIAGTKVVYARKLG